PPSPPMAALPMPMPQHATKTPTMMSAATVNFRASDTERRFAGAKWTSPATHARLCLVIRAAEQGARVRLFHLSTAASRSQNLRSGVSWQFGSYAEAEWGAQRGRWPPESPPTARLAGWGRFSLLEEPGGRAHARTRQTRRRPAGTGR